MIKAGDLVRLKSGGPLMVAYYIDDHTYIHCNWFTRYDELKMVYVKPELLRIANFTVVDMIGGLL